MPNEKEIKDSRYREAAKRIESSINTEHYFEAITIVESIMSDRLASFLRGTETLSNNTINNMGFAQLITVWKVTTKNPGNIWGNCEQLINNIDQWRKSRNKYVHGLVKFPNQKASLVTTNDFILGAKKTAREGRNLAEELMSWRADQIPIKAAYTKMHNKALQSDP